MRYFDNNGRELTLQQYEQLDFKLGYSVYSTKSEYHPEQPEVPEQFHYEVIKEYPNGGKDLRKVIDVEYVPYKAAYTEVYDICTYTLYTKEELRKQEIQDEIDARTKWFNSMVKGYSIWLQELTRAEAEGKTKVIIDDYRGKTYVSVKELYEEADVVADEITKLREELEVLEGN